jgi:hypothetical protein
VHRKPKTPKGGTSRLRQNEIHPSHQAANSPPHGLCMTT